MKKLLVACLLALTAPAAATTYTLTVSTFGPVSPSVITSSNPATGIWCGSTHTACTATFASSATVVLTQVSASTVTFVGWGGAQGCGTNHQTCAVAMTADAHVTATFNPFLSIAVYGVGLGAVSDATGLVDCAATNGCVGAGAQRYNYPKGTHVVLTETAGSSSTFVGWSGFGGCSRASTCTVTLNGYQAIVATFTSAGPFTLAVAVPNGGGTVTSTPPGINCGAVCAAEFASGTSVALTTAAADGWFFAGWANGGCAGQTPCVVTSSSTYQGLGGSRSPAAFFYPVDGVLPNDQ